MLMLNTPETDRPKRFCYDPDVPEDLEALKPKVEALKAQGFRFSAEESGWGEMVLYPPEKDPNQGFMRVLSEEGDSRVVWDRRVVAEVKEAFVKFKELLGKGYTACVARSDGSKGSKLDDFDPLLEEIIMVPPTMPG